jgi:excisionase family DNA binding protein
MDSIKEFYTPKDAADLLSINKMTILRLIKSGQLAATNIGTGQRMVYRISKSALSGFISKKHGNGNTKN